MTTAELGELQNVTVKWSKAYSMPVYVLEDGTQYVNATGEWAGYCNLVQVSPELLKGTADNE